MDCKRVGVVIGAVVAGAMFAATVTVNAPAGSVTNAFAFVAGEDSLAVNTGATGGTVRLNPNNSHTGGTTLGSGTLVVTQPARPEAGIGELGAGPFTQTGGTLRYAGPAGGVWTGAITNRPAVDTSAVVWQIDNDLVMAGDVQQPTGCFIKSGKGTLTFTQPFTLGGCTTSYGNGIYGGYTDFSLDRAPTKGYAPFTIADGTVVIDTPYDESVTNVLSGVDVNLAIGQGTTANGEETTGVLILSNGITRSAGRINVGSTNGRKSNSTSRLQPTLRVLNGATLLVGPTGNKVCYLGVMWSDNTLQWNAPLLEVAGPGSKMWCNGLSISYHKGGNSTVLVRDGARLEPHHLVEQRQRGHDERGGRDGRGVVPARARRQQQQDRDDERAYPRRRRPRDVEFPERRRRQAEPDRGRRRVAAPQQERRSHPLPLHDDERQGGAGWHDHLFQQRNGECARHLGEGH